MDTFAPYSLTCGNASISAKQVRRSFTSSHHDGPKGNSAGVSYCTTAWRSIENLEVVTVPRPKKRASS